MKPFLLFLAVFSSLFSQPPIPSYALIVVGGGAAGLSCATECAKMGFSTLVIDTHHERQSPETTVTNWPGMQPQGWGKAIEGLRKEYERNGGTFQQAEVTKVVRGANQFQLTTDQGPFQSVAVVIATGKRPPELPVGISSQKQVRVFQRYWDFAPFSPDDSVIVIGNSPLGLKAALQISFRVSKVMLFMQPPWQPSGSTLERLAQSFETISWMKADRFISIIPQDKSVLLSYSRKGSTLIQKASWIVFAEPWISQVGPFQPFVQLDSTGSIVTQGETGSTKTPGVFACGDVSSDQEVLGIQAAASGLRTSWPVALYLLEHGVTTTTPAPLPPPPPEKEKAPPKEPAKEPAKIVQMIRSDSGHSARNLEKQGLFHCRYCDFSCNSRSARDAHERSAHGT